MPIELTVAIIISVLSWGAWITIQLFDIKQNLKLLTQSTQLYNPIQCANHLNTFDELKAEDERLKDRIIKLEDKLETVDLVKMMDIITEMSQYVHKIKTNGNEH